MSAHGLKGVNEGVVLHLGAVISQPGLRATPEVSSGQVNESEDGGTSKREQVAAHAQVRVRAGDVQHLADVEVECAHVHGDDAVKCDGPGKKGVAGAAGQVGELLAGNAERAISRMVAK